MFPFPAALVMPLSLHFLSHDMDVYRRSIPEELVDSRKIQIPAPPRLCGPAENYLCNVLFANNLGDFLGHLLARGAYDLGAYVLRKLDVLLQRSLILRAVVYSNVNIDNE